ncbi:MAG: hypothetical protein E7615_03020 [Ruminococcaceae bacterium]|nr:hypothetical protein [Oscillospiraceae bacterium]
MNKTLSLVLCLILMLTLASCAGETETQSDAEATALAESAADTTEETSAEKTPLYDGTLKFDAEKAYNKLLDNYYKLIANPENEALYFEGATGIIEAVCSLGDEALNTIGYAFLDIDSDGIEELFIGILSKNVESVKNELYAVYTHNGEKPVLLLEGMARSAYSYIGKQSFFYHGSGGVAYSFFGEYVFKDETLVPKYYYFTYGRTEEFRKIGFYHNTGEQLDKPVSGELLGTSDEFFALQDELAQKTVQIENIKFSDFKVDNY